MVTRKPAKKSKPAKPKIVTTASHPAVEARKSSFKQEKLDKTVIAIPLLEMLEEGMGDPTKPYAVIIDLNLEYPAGVQGARKWVTEKILGIIKSHGHNKSSGRQGVNIIKSEHTEQYVFAHLEGDVIRQLVKADKEIKKEFNKDGQRKYGPNAIYRVWPDFKVKALMDKSISTVKAEAAQASFSATGDGITWAVIDSGIDKDHPHFLLHNNLELKPPLVHADFTRLNSKDPENALKDGLGHGTHVAGIIAGEIKVSTEKPKKGSKTRSVAEISAFVRQRDEKGDVSYNKWTFDSLIGMAPKCKLLSLKVLDDEGAGDVSNIIAALSLIQKINGYGRRILIQGVNLSVGYEFDPEWFACGQSPLCVEVDRLVRSGVVVVVAAGNTGYGTLQSEFLGPVSATMDLTINDPGNAELAITVGSTHKEMPHVYGVSYFSSKGPTGDGRFKPDLVAPGERIVSCAAGRQRQEMKDNAGDDCLYLEQSGTSMAAPHVSGAIASFLSIKREFIGRPDQVKEIFLSTATDLKRDRYFQGHGLVDLMRAIQSV